MVAMISYCHRKGGVTTFAIPAMEPSALRKGTAVMCISDAPVNIPNA